ncbi:MAG: hypothetical protein ABJB03_01870 [Rhodoglobus sp.]
MRKLMIPVAVALAVTPLFAGCAPSDDDAERDMSAAVVAVSPEIDGALVGYSSSGSELVLSVKAYIPDARTMSAEELAAVVDAGVEAVWFASPQDPFIVKFGVVPSTMPEDATFVQQDIERFPDTGKILESTSGSSNGTFGFLGSALELRFGPRQ